MSRTRLAAQAFCLTLLAVCSGWSDSSRAEAPAPQDSLWSQQWNMKNTGQSGGTPGIDVGLLGAWDFTTGSDQVKVALIGAAAASAHPDFVPASGSNRVIPAGGPLDYTVQGTSVAGILAAEANNGGAVKRGIAGVDQGCIVLNYLDYDSDNIEDAVSSGADVMYLWRATAQAVDAEGAALADAYKHDVVLVAPTGNEAGQYSRYPAVFDGVIGVGGVRDNTERAYHSNTGPMVDLVAPDGAPTVSDAHWLTSLIPPNGYARVYNTDYACAHVAGAASLLRGAHPELSNDDVANVLFLSAKDLGDPGRDDQFGYGLVKIDSALRMLESPNTLRHLPVTSPPSVYSVSDLYACAFYDVEGLATGVYLVKRYEVRAAVSFPALYYHFAGAWGRGNSTTGFSAASPNLGIGFAEFVPGTVTSMGGTIRTYVYEMWDLAGEEYLGFFPCRSEEASFAWSVLGEELLVSPTLTARPADLQLTIDWVDTLPNESAWHVDRNVGYWQTDYAVLPPGTATFTDNNVIQGSYLHTYRIRPVNAHQTPAYSNEVTKRSLPSPPPCISAYTVYMNMCSPTGDPSLCPQNHGTCGGDIELMLLEGNGISVPLGDESMMQQSNSGGGGIDPSCCERSNMIIVEWQPPLAQLAGSIRGYYVVRHTVYGDTWYPRSLGLVDTICGDFNASYTLSVATESIYGEMSYRQLPYVTVETGSRDWCNGGNPLDRRSPDAGEQTGTTRDKFGLQPNTPNPFNSGTVLSFTLAQPESWEMEVLDILGRVVWSKQGHGDAGPVEVAFDGRGDSGRNLASGTYFWRVTTPTASGVRKMSILK